MSQATVRPIPSPGPSWLVARRAEAVVSGRVVERAPVAGNVRGEEKLQQRSPQFQSLLHPNRSSNRKRGNFEIGPFPRCPM